MSDLTGQLDTKLQDLRDFLSDQMHRGFDGTHGRLDQINGRVRKVEGTLERQDERLQTVEEKCGPCTYPIAGPKLGDGENRRITQRDVNVVLGTIGAIAAVTAFVKIVWPILHRIL